MICLTSLWLPILLAAVFVFIASSLIHMVFKWHNSDYRGLANEEEVRAALGSPAPGQYVIPHCLEHKDLEKEEVRRKFTEGPVGFLYIKASGLPGMGSSLTLWFLFNILIAFSVAYLTSRTTPAGTHYLQVFRVAGTAAFLAYAAGTIPNSIFMGKPWRVTGKEILDGLIYALLMAGTFGWLWPR